MPGNRSKTTEWRSVAGTLMVLGLLGPNVAAWSADPERGRELSERYCASCHVIDSEGTGEAAERAPSFPELAADQTKSLSYLRGFLTVPHYPDPELQLGEQEIDDLVAHIETMVQQQQPQLQPGTQPQPQPQPQQ